MIDIKGKVTRIPHKEDPVQDLTIQEWIDSLRTSTDPNKKITDDFARKIITYLAEQAGYSLIPAMFGNNFGPDILLYCKGTKMSELGGLTPEEILESAKSVNCPII